MECAVSCWPYVQCRGELYATGYGSLSVRQPEDPCGCSLVKMNTPAIGEWFLAHGVVYESAWAWQRAKALSAREGGVEWLALVEHAPVYTMGQRGGTESLLVPRESLRAPLVEVERGGDVTWHGPGQLVGYPILNLRARGLRAADYVRGLESVLVSVLARFGIEGGLMAGRPGVWTGGAKIAAIGVAIRGGVSMHGFALNVSPELGWFDAIVPCGIRDAGVTSIERELGDAPRLEDVAAVVREVFADRFGVELRAVDVPAELPTCVQAGVAR